MPRTTHEIFERSRPGRSTYFQAWVGGKVVYLGTDRREAKRILDDKLGKARRKRPIGRPVSVDGLIVAYMLEHASTSKWWVKPLSTFAGDIDIQDIQPDLLERFHAHLKAHRFKQRCVDGSLHGAERGYAPKTIRHYVTVAGSILEWGHSKKWIAHRFEIPKTATPGRTARDYPIQSVADALAGLREPTLSIATFIFTTGCRGIEACRLRWDWYRPDVGTCGSFILPPEAHKTGEKTGQSSTIALTPEARAVIDARLKTRGERTLVFTNRDGQPYTTAGIRSTLIKHGIGRVHGLRHTFAQLVLDRGVPLEELQALLRHSSIGTTQIYAQVRNDRALSAASRLTSLVPSPSGAAQPLKVAGESAKGRRRAR